MFTDDIEEDLSRNIDEFIEIGDYSFEKQKYNAAITSYFKALVILIDLEIYRRKALLPKNHNERFNFIQIVFPKQSARISDLFRKYTDSYNLRMEKEDAEEMKEFVNEFKTSFRT